MELNQLTYAELCEHRDLAESARFANWLAAVRLHSVPDRERTTAQKEKADRHDAISDVWFAYHRECNSRIRDLVESIR